MPLPNPPLLDPLLAKYMQTDRDSVRREQLPAVFISDLHNSGWSLREQLQRAGDRPITLSSSALVVWVPPKVGGMYRSSVARPRRPGRSNHPLVGVQVSAQRR